MNAVWKAAFLQKFQGKCESDCFLGKKDTLCKGCLAVTSQETEVNYTLPYCTQNVQNSMAVLSAKGLKKLQYTVLSGQLASVSDCC